MLKAAARRPRAVSARRAGRSAAGRRQGRQHARSERRVYDGVPARDRWRAASRSARRRASCSMRRLSTSFPRKVAFVAAEAQFTPKTVETASERQKLAFRVKAQIDPELLQEIPRAGEDRAARRGLRAARSARRVAACSAAQAAAVNRSAATPRGGGAGRPSVAGRAALSRHGGLARRRSRTCRPDAWWASSVRTASASPACSRSSPAHARFSRAACGCSAAICERCASPRRMPAHRLHAAGPGQESLPHPVGVREPRLLRPSVRADAARAHGTHRRACSQAPGWRRSPTGRWASSPAA